ncbi:hypothetical protein ACS0TY_033007 [Phlomoides rotata]
MPERNPQIIAEQNPTNCLRRSPRFLSENRIALGTSKREKTPPCSRKKDARSQISRRKCARLDNRAAAFSCLDLQKQCVTEKRVTRSSTGGIKAVNYKEYESDEIVGKRDNREIKSSKGTKRSARLVHSEEKRMTRSSLGRNTAVIETISGVDSCKENIEKRDQELYTNKKRRQGEKKSKRNEVEEEEGGGWTKEQQLSLRTAYFLAKPTPQFWKKVATMVPGKSAKECFDRIHSDQSTPSQPPARSRPKRKEPSPILFSPTKLLSPAVMNHKKRISRMRSTLAAQKTVRKLLQKQHTEDQDYEADLFSVLEPTIDPSPLNLQDGTPFSSPAPNQGSSSAQRKQRSRLSNSQKAAFVSPPVLKQIKNKALHEKYIDQLHCRDAKRKAAASTKAKKVYANVSILKPNLVKVAKDALVSDAQDAINQLRSLQSGTDYSIDDDDDIFCSSSDEDEFC